MSGLAATTVEGAGRDRVWPTVLGVWGLTVAVLLLLFGGEIVALEFPDPDDSMRLLEVRDWLAGQSWWDLGQHRLNGGDFPMHWSRLVDLPLAAFLWLGKPVLGTVWAERVAMTAVPLLTLLCVMLLAAAITRRMLGSAAAQAATPLAALTVPLLMQLRPMRIDHHGWQIALALAAVLALVQAPTRRGGALCGLALAALLTVSLEGLPISAAIAGVAALAWAWSPARWRGAALALAWTLFGAAAVLHLLTRGPALLAPACDAMSPVWLLALGVAASGLTAAAAFGRATLAVRLAGLVVAGAGAAATLVALAPECLRGPFASLDPLVRRMWYEHVPEGLPITEQGLAWATINVAMPLVALVGCALGWRSTRGEERERWAILCAITLAAFLIMLNVVRAGGTANAVALPGAAAALGAMLRRARAVRSTAPRAAATAAAILAASPGLAVGTIATHLSEPDASGAEAQRGRPSCDGFEDVRALGRLPASTIFLPVDPSPDLIATTRHRAIAGGYHRGQAAILKVFTAFTSAPERAEAIVRATGARYLAVCPGLQEPAIYRRTAPNGLWARLDRGERVPWLRPVPMPGAAVLAWEVVPRR